MEGRRRLSVMWHLSCFVPSSMLIILSFSSQKKKKKVLEVTLYHILILLSRVNTEFPKYTVNVTGVQSVSKCSQTSQCGRLT
jgi:hypothetical protein